MNDSQVRANFHSQKLQKYHNSSNILVIDELGIKHGKNLAYIAVINESLKSLNNADVSTTDISSGLQFSRYTIVNGNELLPGTLKVEY